MKKMRMAVIGCGTWGASHAHLYADDMRVELVALCDVVPGKAAALAEKVGVGAEHTYTDYKRMIDCEEIDAVSIVTPDFLHCEYACYCADHKKHILIEKPIATTREEADAIYDAVRRNGVRAMVDFHNRWNPPFAVMKEEVQSGAVGEPYSGYIRLNDQKWVATGMLKWAAKSSILWFLGSHAVDTMRWLFESEPETVYAVSREGLMRKEGVDTVDSYQYIITFRNGCIASFENAWITPDSNLNVNDFKCNLTCTNGMYNLDLSNHNMIQRFADRATVPDVLVNTFVRGYPNGFAYKSIQHFVDCLVNDTPFYVSLEDAYNDTATILAVFESAKLGQPVRVQGLKQAY